MVPPIAYYILIDQSTESIDLNFPIVISIDAE